MIVAGLAYFCGVASGLALAIAVLGRVARKLRPRDPVREAMAAVFAALERARR